MTKHVVLFSNGPAWVARVHVFSGARSYAIEADGETQAAALIALQNVLADAFKRACSARPSLIVDTALCGPPSEHLRCPHCKALPALIVDDEGTCACQAAYVVTWYDGGAERLVTAAAAAARVRARYPEARPLDHTGAESADTEGQWFAFRGTTANALEYVATIDLAVRS